MGRDRQTDRQTDRRTDRQLSTADTEHMLSTIFTLYKHAIICIILHVHVCTLVE